jgi:glycosyltransferase involved in cell wall biosynthesis
MRFSVIMPSYLGHYRNAANNREVKIERAIESVLGQRFTDWELIIIADGCDRTVEIAAPYFYENLPKIRLLEIEKQKLWSGTVRNSGISKAEGEIITYLDIDDKIGENHLQIINDNFGDADWVFYNDYYWDRKIKGFTEHESRIVPGECGTSNISHRRSINAWWKSNTYMHDFVMINTLIPFKMVKIPAPEYYVCHLPNRYDV